MLLLLRVPLVAAQAALYPNARHPTPTQSFIDTSSLTRPPQGFAEPFESQKTILADIRTDLGRSAYYREYMEAILIALSQGVNVVGCLAWSLVDNLEWAQGYEPKFGMQYVNFTTQERYYKASFFEYVNTFKVYGSGSSIATMRV